MKTTSYVALAWKAYNKGQLDIAAIFDRESKVGTTPTSRRWNTLLLAKASK